MGESRLILIILNLTQPKVDFGKSDSHGCYSEKKNRKTWEPPLFFITHPELLLFESKDAERRKHWDEP